MSASDTVESSALAQASEDQLIELLQATLYADASPEAIRQVVRYCRALNVEPLCKPVHLVLLWDERTGQAREAFVPGIGLYRTIAARSGWAGMDEPEFGPDLTESVGGRQLTYPQWCRVTVRRRLATGETVQFTAKEFWKENVALSAAAPEGFAAGGAGPNDMWSRRPYGQLAKCTEAQALRKAFPEIGAQPVLEELEGKLQERWNGNLRARPDPARETLEPAGGDDPGEDAASQSSQFRPTQRTEAGSQAAPRTARPEEQDVPMPRAKLASSAPSGTSARGKARRAGGPVGVAGAPRLTAMPASMPTCTTEPGHEPASEPLPGPAMPSSPSCEAAAPSQFEPLTTGEMAYLRKRLAARNMTVAAARTAAGLSPGGGLEDLGRSDFAALKRVTA